MAFELVQLKNFSPSELISKQSKRSSLNFEFNKLYSQEHNINKAKLEMIKMEADQHGLDRNATGFQLLMKQVAIKMHEQYHKTNA